MKLFKFANVIEHRDPQNENATPTSTTRDVYVLVGEGGGDGVVFAVGTRLTHKVQKDTDLFPLGEEAAGKLGMPDNSSYNIRKTVPFLLSCGKLTEMPKEARGYLVGFDKRVKDFKRTLEEYIDNPENALPQDKMIITLVPSLSVSLRLRPGLGFGDVSEDIVNKVFSKPGTLELPFKGHNNSEVFRNIDFNRGHKKLADILSQEKVNVDWIRA